MISKNYRWLSILLLAFIAGCYPDGADYVEEIDLVYTNYAPAFDFKAKRTFAMPDSVVKITGDNVNDPDGNGKPEFDMPDSVVKITGDNVNDPDGNGKPEFVKSTYSTAIISSLKQQMQANGWQLVNKNSNPDLLLLPSTMTTTNIYYYYDWWYWDWWYGGWYGWYYPGWWYPPYVTGYRSGSVFIQLVERPTATQVADNVTVVWNMVLNGLAEGDQTNISARIQSGIAQGFQQSPYLKIN